MTSSRKSFLIVVPVYNERECLPELFRRLGAVRDTLAESYEVRLLFVDDGSSDGSTDMLLQLGREHAFVQVVVLSRNFGHQLALTAGLDNADADYVGVIDADLQDPPELFPAMLERAEAGVDVVYGRRTMRDGETAFKRGTAKAFYAVLSRACSIDIPRDTGDFRLINRRALAAFKRMREQHRFIRGMIPWMGFSSEAMPYERDRRYAGETKYPLKKMLRFALDAILSFSSLPVRLSLHIGVATFGLGVLVGLVVLYLRLFTDYYVPGISAVIILNIVFWGVQFIIVGLIGEYIGRIYEESKRRPLYLVAETMNLATGQED